MSIGLYGVVLASKDKRVNKFRISRKGNVKIFRVEQLNQFLFIKEWKPLPNEYHTHEDAVKALETYRKIFEQDQAKWEPIIVELNNSK